MIYLIIWLLFIHWYFCTMIFPNCFTNISEKNLKKEQISDNSKLNLLYLKKDVDPKLRLVALDAILLFLWIYFLLLFGYLFLK